MTAVILGALALFALAVAAVVRGSPGYRAALASAIALAVVAAGLAIAGEIRWTGCTRQSYDPAVRTRVDSGKCPPRGPLGIRDPWDNR